MFAIDQNSPADLFEISQARTESGFPLDQINRDDYQGCKDSRQGRQRRQIGSRKCVLARTKGNCRGAGERLLRSWKGWGANRSMDGRRAIYCADSDRESIALWCAKLHPSVIERPWAVVSRKDLLQLP